MEDLSKVKDRIAKMLAKANNNSNVHEAAIAARRARALMDKHQLDELDIAGVEKKAHEFAAQCHGKDYAFMPIYRDLLAVAVGKFNDCWVSREGVKHGRSVRYRVMFKGMANDVGLATQMWDYLCDTVDAMCKAHMKERGYTRYVASVGDAFKKACASTLCSRLAEATIEREQIMGLVGTGLMVVKQELIAQHFEQAPPKYVNVRFKSKATSEADLASAAGAAAGRKIEIVKSLND